MTLGAGIARNDLENKPRRVRGEPQSHAGGRPGTFDEHVVRARVEGELVDREPDRSYTVGIRLERDMTVEEFGVDRELPHPCIVPGSTG